MKKPLNLCISMCINVCLCVSSHVIITSSIDESPSVIDFLHDKGYEEIDTPTTIDVCPTHTVGLLSKTTSELEDYYTTEKYNKIN